MRGQDLGFANTAQVNRKYLVNNTIFSSATRNLASHYTSWLGVAEMKKITNTC